VRLVSNKRSFDTELEVIRDFNKVIPVKVDTVQKTNISGEFCVNGSFLPMHEVSIVSEIQGKVVSINVEAGSRVISNQTLAVTDNRVLESQLELAKANFEKSKKDLERFEQLSKDDAVSLQQYESAKLALAGYKSAFIAAGKEYDNSIIKSPFAGIITKRNIEKGTYLSPGNPAFDIIEISKVKFIVKLKNDEVKKVKIGQTVKVYADAYQGVNFEGKVNSVIIKADESKRYDVEIEVINRTDKIIMPGMFGSVLFTGESENLLVIPRKALTGSIKTPEVYIVKGDSVVLKSISVNPVNEKYLFVSQGLLPGDIVVISGQINLKNGSKIKVQ
jgi:membrane fusion protein, multidrug efflux system